MKPILGILTACLLVGCAPAVTSRLGQNLTKGDVVAEPVTKAVRMSAKANLLHQGKRLKFDVWIEADSVRGRLDALGPFGTPLATVIWQDSAWKAWLPGQSTLLRGVGNAVNLPVLGLKDVHPSLLVAPFLGRTLPTEGSVRTVPVGDQTQIFPQSPNPTWSLLIDNATGLPTRKQNLVDGREVEGLTFHKWTHQGELLVPGTVDRTTPDGQLLQLDLDEWHSIPSIPPQHLELKLHGAIDTITLAHNERGQTVYRIRAAGANGDSTSVVIASQSMTEAPIDTLPATVDDSTESAWEDQDDTSEVLEPDSPAAAAAESSAPSTATTAPQATPAPAAIGTPAGSPIIPRRKGRKH